MRTRRAWLTTAFLAALTPLACGGGGPDAGAPKDAQTAPAAPKPKPPTTYSVVSVSGYGVQLEAPANAQVREAGDHYMISSDDFAECTAVLNKIDPGYAKLQNYESAVKDAERSTMGGAIKTRTKQEKRPDGGYALEWTYTDGIEKKDAWGVSYRSVLGGTIFDCDRNGIPSAEAAACVVHMCTSLKKP